MQPEQQISIDGIHVWLVYHYGNPQKCENEGNGCRGTSKYYEWSVIHEKGYAKDRSHFRRLCRSCHRRYDKTPEKIAYFRSFLGRRVLKRNCVECGAEFVRTNHSGRRCGSAKNKTGCSYKNKKTRWKLRELTRPKRKPDTQGK